MAGARHRGIGWGCLLCASFVNGACSSDEADGSSNLTGVTPEQLCERKCDQQVAASCANTPSDYGQSCAMLCMAKYQNFPTCVEQSKALDNCATTRVSYGCTDDVISATPMGACANEGLQCANCTGDLFSCL